MEWLEWSVDLSPTAATATVVKYVPNVWFATIIIIKVDSPCDDYVPGKIIIYFTARARRICMCVCAKAPD